MHKDGRAKAAARVHKQRRCVCTNSSAERSCEKSGEKSGDNINYKTYNIFAASAACVARIAALPQPGKGIIGLTGQ